MKSLLTTVAIIFLIYSDTYTQNLQYPEYVDTGSESIVVTEVEDAIAQSTTYNEVVIIAKDSGTTPIMPEWFNETINGLHLFFSEGTFGQFDYNPIVLKKEESEAFLFKEVYRDTFPGNCWHVHKKENMIDVIEQADAIYDFDSLDFNGDNIVPVHFASIGPLSGGVSGNCLTVTTTDTGVGGQYVQVRVVQQTRGINQDAFRGVFYHESGHTFFSFPDMNHSSNGDFSHYGIGAFDIMCGGGFQGIPSLYNPWFRNVRQWCSPTLIETNLTGVILEDFQTSQSYKLFIPSYNPPNAMADQKFLISYHTPENQFYSSWPYSDPVNGGALVWHTRENTVLKFDSYSDWRRMKLDVESAHGKFKWNEFPTYVANTGIDDPLTGRDSLEIRKIIYNGDYWEEIQGPYFQQDDGSASIFFTPDEAGDFAFYSNPNSNYYVNSSGEAYAQNIVSGFSMKNLRTDNNQVKADFYVNDLTITGSRTLTSGRWYFNSDLIVSGNLTLQSGTELRFQNGASLTVNGSLIAQGTISEPIIFDFSSSANNGIVVRNGGTINLDYCTIKNASTGISTFHAGNTIIVNHSTFENITQYGISVGTNTQKLEVSNSTFDNCGSYCINIFGPMATTPKISTNNFENCDYGILATTVNSVLIRWNNFTDMLQAVSIVQVPDAHIIGNNIFSNNNTGLGIFFNNSNGYIRKNFISGYGTGITLANSSPKIGENQIYFNQLNGIYASSGSVPDIRLFLGVSITPGCPPYYYALSGCNDIFENGGYSEFPFIVGDDGSEIYLASSNILMDNGNNRIFDDREEIPPLYHTLFLMNGTNVPKIKARYNWWGFTDLSNHRFGNLVVGYEPVGANGCPVPIEQPCSLIVQTSDGIVVDTLYPLNEEESFSELEEMSAEAGGYYLSGDYINAETVYSNIVEEYPDSLESIDAGLKLFAIEKIQNSGIENFITLQNFYNNYLNSISDSLIMQIVENLNTLCYIGQEEYETAINRFEEIINQNPGGEEAIYAEIDAITTSMLADSGGGNLGKYSSSSIEEYGNKIGSLINKLNSSGNKSTSEQLIPVEYKLYQNYPNPFNPVTTIKYDIVKLQDVSLKIYDVLGREVKTLVNEQQQPGSYQVNWDAATVSSGIYFYQLKTKDYVNTKKMILLK